MLVLIFDDAPIRQAELALAFMHAGFQTVSTSDREFAEHFIEKGLVDLLVMTERVGGRLTHALSLLAEYQNPLVETILMTHRKDGNIDELFALLPSLHCMVAPDTAPGLITKLAISAVTGVPDQRDLSDALSDTLSDTLADDAPLCPPASALLPGRPAPNSGVFETEAGELLKTA